MGIEIDLLRNYPKSNRDIDARAEEKTEEDREIARRFGREFFDGERKTGYGGFSYNSKYWSPVVPDFIEHFSLAPHDSLLDVGCAKGFMLNDFIGAIPELEVVGVDISDYAVENSLASVREHLHVASAVSLPFPDKRFDVVISINTIHNLDLEDCKTALQEIERVSRRGSFITVDAFRNEVERERMMKWNLTAKTILSVDEWKQLFDEVGFSGDYFWFIP